LKLDTYRGHSAFYTWLYRIAVNMALSYRRGTKPVVSMDQQQEMTGQEAVAQNEVVGEALEREERAAVLHEAIGALSEQYRSIIILREIEGCNYDDIAKILSISSGTVRSRLHRARMQLKEKLLPLLNEHPSLS
jgi:RNA polymerase sigma-70 factor (ECF subfamily)